MIVKDEYIIFDFNCQFKDLNIQNERALLLLNKFLLSRIETYFSH